MGEPTDFGNLTRKQRSAWADHYRRMAAAAAENARGAMKDRYDVTLALEPGGDLVTRAYEGGSWTRRQRIVGLTMRMAPAPRLYSAEVWRAGRVGAVAR